MKNDRKTYLGATLNGAAQPLVRLATAKPALKALDTACNEADAVLTRVGLSRASFDDTEAYVHAIVMYQFFEEAAAAIPDPQFMARIGAHLANSNWPPLVTAAQDATTLGSFLTAVVIVAADHSSSTEHHLQVAGKTATLYGQRHFEPPFTPGQIDAFFSVLFAHIIKRVVDVDWSPSDVLLKVSEPSAIPPVFLGIQPIKGDHFGHRLVFPARWLLKPFSSRDFFSAQREPSGKQPPTRTLSGSVRDALRAHIAVGPVSSKSAATICGLSEQQLSRRLRKEGTSIGRIIADLKRERAERLLGDENMTVTKVAELLGYSDATSFAHAFRNWTGKAPSQVRRERQ